MEKYSQLLFARPSFLEGIARVLDVGGTLQEYNASGTGDEADYAAFAADMAALRADLIWATAQGARELGIIDEQAT
jgi:hypothetical protein